MIRFLMITGSIISHTSQWPIPVPAGPGRDETADPEGNRVVAHRIRLYIRQRYHQIRHIGCHGHQPHYPVPSDLLQPLLIAFFRLPLLCQSLTYGDEVQYNEEDIAERLAKGGDEAHPPSQASIQHSNPRQPEEMVEEEVNHFACIRKHRKESQEGGRPWAAPERVEAGEESASSEGLAAEPGSHLPLLGPAGCVGVLCFRSPVGELGDVLEGLDELVDAISLGEEDDELVDSVVAHGEVRGWRRMELERMDNGVDH